MTTNVSINFLRKPAPADLIGRAKLIKLGKRLAVGEVALFSEGEARWSPMRPGPIRSRRAAKGSGIMIPHAGGPDFRHISAHCQLLPVRR